jgi:oligopeptide transport system substrate-binding protein
VATLTAGLALSLAALGACKSDDASPYYGTTTRPSNKDLHTLYLNNGSEPEYLDPGKCNDTASSALVDSMFEGLLHYGPDAQPVPGMALRWDKTDDNRLYRFHLREDAKWSDGVAVTAKDFDFAWKRVLLPKTTSRSASSLYVLKNGELFNLGLLKSTTEAVDVVAGISGEKVGRIEKGAAVRILGKSPRKVMTAIAPLVEAPAGVTEIDLDPGNPKTGAPELLRLGPANGGKVLAPATDKAWSGRAVKVKRRLAPVKCNGQDDHFWEVVDQGLSGVLPGCALGDVPRSELTSDGELALVAPFTNLPTFAPRVVPEASGGAVPDGREVTAASPEPIGFVPVAKLVSDPAVLGVRATGDHTLEVELENPTPYFLDLLCHATLAPVRKDIVEPFEEKGDADMWTRPESIVVNGPYTLDEHKFRYEITMKRNPHYYAHDALAIHRIVWLQVEQYTATLQLYKAADIDWTGQNSSLPSEYIPLLENKKDYESVLFLGVYWYEFNVKVPPVNDVRVRRALNLAVDKQQIVKNITRAGQVPATHYVPDITGLGYAEAAKRDRDKGFDPFAGPNADLNPERARQLLGEAGFPVVKDGDGWRCEGIPAIEILYNTSEGHKQIAVAVQDMWKRHLGISATLRNEEWKVMLKNVRDGNFQVVRFGWFADYNHPQTFLDNFLSFSPNNHPKWADSRFDTTMKLAASAADPVESMKHYREAERIAIDGMSRLPLYFYTKNSMVKPWVKGFHFNARNQMLPKWMWIDPSWEKNASDDAAIPVPEAPPPGRY